MYYIEKTENIITGKGEGEFKTDEQVKVSEEIYNALTNLPAEYTELNGEIISVSTLPIPEPPTPKPTKEELMQQEINDLREIIDIMLGGAE